ncbi:DNA repair photolyase [Tenacibaculum sp. MAR_2010_89]|uniref:radical SAM protein n=1 Tax=Tenacibaculum sp. MAR_2010_89 TaxID=1250198 RepID=UPI0008972061|nr:radical SAM protein [Tenacibaculum sp. MAR_2010_89]SEE28911.1 DNA repair photolyase [Tenacibaculum sp. MAR_2010_89]
MTYYKNSITITSQLFFCSSPIRIDPYNTCQFGCSYCFSKKRSKLASNKGLQIASPDALRARLTRIKNGTIKSALDEMFEQRIPVQLGGLQDPFTDFEKKNKITYEILKVLKDFDYPTMVSTKGKIFLEPQYLNLLSGMNIMFRLSVAGITESKRAKVDIGCDSFHETLKKIGILKKYNIPVSIRIQPIIPTYESNVLEMIKKIAIHGGNHVALEHLKISVENKTRQIESLNNALGIDLWNEMMTLGMTKIGRDYSLKQEAIKPFIIKAQKLCKDLGLAFGAGDTGFIHWSDGNGCCNGSSLFLKEANQFDSNIIGALKNAKNGKVYFNDILEKWSPNGNIHRFLNKNSRKLHVNNEYTSWQKLIAYRWNGKNSPYSPIFFDGVTWNGEYDSNGFKVYEIQKQETKYSG